MFVAVIISFCSLEFLYSFVFLLLVLFVEGGEVWLLSSPDLFIIWIFCVCANKIKEGGGECIVYCICTQNLKPKLGSKKEPSVHLQKKGGGLVVCGFKIGYYCGGCEPWPSLTKR